MTNSKWWLAAFLLVVSSSAEAGIVFVSDRASLAATDSIDWSAAGANNTSLTNPFSVSSAGSLTVGVSATSSGNFERREQSNSWFGNFAPGAALLWNMNHGPITLDFGASGLYAGGTQIQANFYGDFVARIEALDQSGSVLASFTRAGNSNSGGNDSAIFLGLRSDTANIYKLRFSLDSADSSPEDFAINRVDLSSDVRPTPEPGGLLLAATAAVGATVGGFSQRRRRV